MLLAPIGALIARYGRTLFTWFPAHRAIQLGTSVFMLIGFILGVAGVSAEGSSHFTETHHWVGLIILILLIIQIALGYWAHSYRGITGKRFVGYAHIPLGVLLFGLSVWNTQSGFDLWTVQPTFKVSYIIYGWAVLITVVYIGGLLLLPREFKQQRLKISEGEVQSQEVIDVEKIQRREIDGLLPFHEYSRYNHMNNSEVMLTQDNEGDVTL